MNAITVRFDNDFFVTGGTLSRDALCYVVRQADHQLYDALRQGSFCYVLTPRQMGKSSLMVRTASRLRERGAGVVVLDLTAIGQNLSAEQWYGGLLTQMALQLALEGEMEQFWDSNPKLGPLQRWMQAIRQVVLPRYHGQLVIFIDEIDAVRSLPFSTDEFFAGIREFYNHRTEDAEVERLSFCLLGVASPSDLIRDTRMTPFNIGQRVEISDFTESEAAPLTQGLDREPNLARSVLQRVLYWTGGHPYLTQRLCQAVADDASVDNTGVDRLCEELFLSTRARETDDNLLFVRQRLLRNDADLANLLHLYKKVLGRKPVLDDETNPLVSILRLSGVIEVADGSLRVRNRIYERVFNHEWLIANMPDAELRRQRAAYRKGILRASLAAAVILAVLTGVSLAAIQQRNRAVTALARAEAEKLRADDNAQKALMSLARVEEERQRADANAEEALRNLEEANEQRKHAEHQRLVGVKQQAIALQQRHRTELALEQQRLAERKEVEAVSIAEQRRIESELRQKRIDNKIAERRRVQNEHTQGILRDTSARIKDQEVDISNSTGTSTDQVEEKRQRTDTVTVTVRGSTPWVFKGDDLNAAVLVHGDVEVSSSEISLTYDPNLLELKLVRDAGLLSRGGQKGEFKYTATGGVLRVQMACPQGGGGVKARGQLLVVIFIAKYQGIISLQLDEKTTFLRSSSGEIIPIRVQSSKVEAR